MKERKLIIHNQKEAEDFGLELAKDLKPGSVIALTGDLGVGKTTLTKAIAKGLGIESIITSPTFLLVQEHQGGRLPLYHFDVYRIDDEEEMFELGFQDYFDGDGVCVVEWADKIQNLLPPDATRIHMEYGEKEGGRIYTVEVREGI